MAVSTSHLFSQGPVLAALARVAAGAAVSRPGSSTKRDVPGPWVRATLPPRPAALVADFVRDAGGDPSHHRGVVPAAMFPQWAFPLAARTLEGLPYPMLRVLNAGARIEPRAPLPAHEALDVRARLLAVDDDGARALITQEIITGTRSAPDALRCEMRAFVPLAKKRGREGDKKPAARVPERAREIARLAIPARAGLDFALLTGDFNPIHWVPAYARAAGFRACILHGFGVFARAAAALERAVLAGAPSRLAHLDLKFTRPLALPARVSVFVTDDRRVLVGDAPGGGVFADGSFDLVT